MPAAHLFMTLVGPGKSTILGESEVAGYEGQIVLDDWSWGLSRKKENEKSQTVPSVLSFSKALDRSTTALLTCLRSGAVLPSADITLEEAADVDFELVLRLKDIRVQGYELEGEVNDTDGRLKEKWIFNYHTIEFEYAPTQRKPREQRGALKALLTRPPGASGEAVGGNGPKDKIFEVMKKVPEPQRRPLLTSVEKEMATWKPDKPKGKDE